MEDSVGSVLAQPPLQTGGRRAACSSGADPAAVELPGPCPELPSCALCSASSPPTPRTLGDPSRGLLVPDLGTSLARWPAA